MPANPWIYSINWTTHNWLALLLLQLLVLSIGNLHSQIYLFRSNIPQIRASGPFATNYRAQLMILFLLQITLLHSVRSTVPFEEFLNLYYCSSENWKQLAAHKTKYGYQGENINDKLVESIFEILQQINILTMCYHYLEFSGLANSCNNLEKYTNNFIWFRGSRDNIEQISSLFEHAIQLSIYRIKQWRDYATNPVRIL